MIDCELYSTPDRRHTRFEVAEARVLVPGKPKVNIPSFKKNTNVAAQHVSAPGTLLRDNSVQQHQLQHENMGRTVGGT